MVAKLTLIQSENVTAFNGIKRDFNISTYMHKTISDNGQT